MCPITKKVVRTYRRHLTDKPVHGDMHLRLGNAAVLRVDGQYVTYHKGEATTAILKLINLLKGKSQ